MAEEIKVTPTGYLKAKITIDEATKESSFAFMSTGIEVMRGVGFYERILLRIGDERVVALREGLYEVRAFLGKTESDWVNTEIKNGELTSKIFHFGKKPTQ